MKYSMILLLVWCFSKVSAEDLGAKEEMLLMIEESYSQFYWSILKEFLPPNVTIERKPDLRDSGSSKLKVDFSELFSYVKELIGDSVQPLIDIFQRINLLSRDSVSPKGHKEISRLFITAYVFYFRAAIFMSRSSVEVVKAVKGDTCFNFPDLEGILKIFNFRGGKICPFSDLLLRDVDIVDSWDSWIVTFPLVYNTVDMDFASLEMDLGFLGTHSTPKYQLHANLVQIEMSVRFSKTLIPYPRSMSDLEIRVEGCNGFSRNSGWIMRHVIKYAMKLCDPIINRMLKVTIFFVPLQMKIVKWLSKLVLKKGSWAKDVGVWFIKHFGPVLVKMLLAALEANGISMP